MKKSGLKKIVDGLHPKFGRMVAFGKSQHDKLECPWLRWTLNLNGGDVDEDIGTEGILIMQDWGVEEEKPESIDEAINHIDQCINGKYDRTITNLMKGDWKTKIQNRKILVTNAVWGLRKKNGSTNTMCGYLKAEIHKRAFLTWGSIVKHISSQTTYGDFRLFVAGEWARLDNEENNTGEEISKYLARWSAWVSKRPHEVKKECFPIALGEGELNECKGRVVFLNHPCTWNSVYESKPFAPF